MKKSAGFSLVSTIIIIIVTSIITTLATGIIIYNNDDKSIVSGKEDKELQEFIEVYETLLSRYYNDIDKEGMLNAAEEGMLNFLGDKYTTYLNDEEYKDIIDELAGTYEGVGIEVIGNKIVGIVKDSPAANSGLKEGDSIIRINSINVTNMDSNAIGNLIKNDATDSINIIIERDGEELDFNLKKATLINKVVNYKVLDGTNIGYLSISIFAENLSSQVSKALKELEKEGITSLIIDVRDNVGGYLSAAEEVSSLFLENGKTIYSLKTSNTEFAYKDKTKEKRDYDIIVLINGSSASASEILAAALKDSYGATLVGVKSYGKGKVQQVVELDNGDSVKYTSAEWLTPNGVCIDGVGIMPDYSVINSRTEDLQLAKAIELLQWDYRSYLEQ